MTGMATRAVFPPQQGESATSGDRRALIVEDDPATASFLQSGLRDAGYAVDVAADGSEGAQRARRGSYDVILLDRMLPGLDGLSLLARLRDEGDQTPVIFLSAIGSTDERVRGLRAGSDDYLVKPVAMSELLARIDVLHRRRGPADTVVTRLSHDDLTLDLLSSRAERAGRPLLLQPRALQLLEFLMRHPGQVVTRAMIFQTVWNYDFDPRTNVIDVYMSNLRREVDLPGLAPLLHTVRGTGYRLGPAA
jgi:two-component system OmpR family response regulator